MLAALNHPNVLRFYGVVTKEVGDQTVVGIMTEFMPGSSLSNYLRYFWLCTHYSHTSARPCLGKIAQI